jgi:hypothetical protein
MNVSQVKYLPQVDRPPGEGSRGSEKNAAFFKRLTIATFGAAFLIGPMWLMMLRTDLDTKLISTTVFVAVLGLLMAYFIEEHKNVFKLSSTAADATVLVVFVGLSSTPELLVHDKDESRQSNACVSFLLFCCLCFS